MAIGFVRRPHGVRGELLVGLLTDFPERFRDLERVHLVTQDAMEGSEGGGPAETRGAPFEVESVREVPGGVLMKLRGIVTRDDADKVRGRLLAVTLEEAVPLPPGEYYPFQLVGLAVVTTAGEALGRIREVHRYPANDVYEVWDEARGREILLPAIASVVKGVDLAAGTMTVELLEGLVD